jgi:hypothetical protein
MDMKQLIGSLAGNDPKLIEQMNNMVKMLDDLAENDPEGYKKFIKGNLEQGSAEMKKEMKQKVDEITRDIGENNFVMTLTFPLTLRKDHLPEVPRGVLISEPAQECKLPEAGRLLLSVLKYSNHPADPSSGHLQARQVGNTISVSMIVVISPGDAEIMASGQGQWRDMLGKCIQKAQQKIAEEMEWIEDTVSGKEGKNKSGAKRALPGCNG